MVDVLYVRRDSVYKSIAGCDPYDAQRDARNSFGQSPIVAHPPCGQWGRLRAFARVNLLEKSFGVLAVAAVRKRGGILEHPCGSLLWKHCGLPLPGQFDKWGGYTLPVLQQWFGHRAEKATWLYIVGLPPENLPAIPFVMGEAAYVVQSRRRDSRPHISKADREHTPKEFAQWLIEVAKAIEGKRGLNG